MAPVWNAAYNPNADRLWLMRSALEQASVVFTDGKEPGVKLRKAEA